MKDKKTIFEVDKNNEDKKQLFIDAAICSLANHGYKGTTVRQIAKYAGVTPGLLTHYYIGKEVLIAESYKYLATQFLDDFQNKINEGMDNPISALRGFFQNIFAPENLGKRYLRVWLAFWTLTLTEESLRNTHSDIYKEYTKSLENILRSAYIHNEQDPSKKNLRSLAVGILAMLDGLWLECCLDPDALSKNDNLGIIYEFVESTTGLKIKTN